MEEAFINITKIIKYKPTMASNEIRKRSKHFDKILKIHNINDTKITMDIETNTKKDKTNRKHNIRKMISFTINII